MGLLDSFRFLSKSKYLGFVGLIVLSYGLSMEFTEIVWKVWFGLEWWGRLGQVRAGQGVWKVR